MIKQTEKGLLISLKIVPNSSKNELIIEESGIVKVKVTAQPIENKANKALIEFLSKLFKIPKSKFEIVKGETSKEKTIFIETSNQEQLGTVKKALIDKSKKNI